MGNSASLEGISGSVKGGDRIAKAVLVTAHLKMYWEAVALKGQKIRLVDMTMFIGFIKNSGRPSYDWDLVYVIIPPERRPAIVLDGHREIHIKNSRKSAIEGRKILRTTSGAFTNASHNSGR